MYADSFLPLAIHFHEQTGLYLLSQGATFYDSLDTHFVFIFFYFVFCFVWFGAIHILSLHRFEYINDGGTAAQERESVCVGA